jgi:cytidylate kinase
MSASAPLPLPGGAVLDGRDIGTVIAPEAPAKLFVIASVAARAQSRFLEMQSQGRDVALAEIEADLEARDRRDRERTQAPCARRKMRSNSTPRRWAGMRRSPPPLLWSIA